MSSGGFAAYLDAQEEDGVVKKAMMRYVEDFEAFLDVRGIGLHHPEAITREVIGAYILSRRDGDADLPARIAALAEYAMYLGHETLRTEMVLLRDAPEVMNRLSAVTRERYGEDVWQGVFGDTAMPEIGWTLEEMSGFTRAMEQRYLAAAPKEAYECACEQVAHGWTPAWDTNGRENFLRIGNIDALCAQFDQNLIKTLEECRDTGTLFFTQEVDDEVIDYVRKNPYAHRAGNKIHIRKMPFLTKRYLETEDLRMKRYYACHCPWARNAILQDEGPVSRSFCHCSMGLSKKAFEVAFDRPLTGRTRSSALDEDASLCVFEIDIPEDILSQYA